MVRSPHRKGRHKVRVRTKSVNMAVNSLIVEQADSGDTLLVRSPTSIARQAVLTFTATEEGVIYEPIMDNMVTQMVVMGMDLVTVGRGAVEGDPTIKVDEGEGNAVVVVLLPT